MTNRPYSLYLKKRRIKTKKLKTFTPLNLILSGSRSDNGIIGLLSTEDIENISYKYKVSVYTGPLANVLILIDGNEFEKLNTNETFARTNSNGELTLNHSLADAEIIALTDFTTTDHYSSEVPSGLALKAPALFISSQRRKFGRAAPVHTRLRAIILTSYWSNPWFTWSAPTRSLNWIT
ncbi:MAG: hypothetical protein EBX20_04875 [Rhodobacterales bacterium]|nr:hypothetical protein [Rhodobacterales bacterium]